MIAPGGRTTATNTLVSIDTLVQWIRGRTSVNVALNSRSFDAKGTLHGRYQCTPPGTERSRARGCACRNDHAECERFYRARKTDGWRAAQALRRSARL